VDLSAAPGLRRWFSPTEGDSHGVSKWDVPVPGSSKTHFMIPSGNHGKPRSFNEIYRFLYTSTMVCTWDTYGQWEFQDPKMEVR